MTKVVSKSTSTLINKMAKLRDGIWKILAKQIFTTFAKSIRGFIYIYIRTRLHNTRKIRTLTEKKYNFYLLTSKKKVLFILESGAIASHHNTHSLSQLE